MFTNDTSMFDSKTQQPPHILKVGSNLLPASTAVHQCKTAVDETCQSPCKNKNSIPSWDTLPIHAFCSYNNHFAPFLKVLRQPTKLTRIVLSCFLYVCLADNVPLSLC